MWNYTSILRIILLHRRSKYSWNDTDNSQFLERLKNKASKRVENKTTTESIKQKTQQ